MCSSPAFGLFPRVRRPAITVNQFGPDLVGVGRRLAAALACHPVALATVVGSRLLGWPVVRAVAIAAVADRTVPAIVARSSMPPARFLVVWTHACRFRRRWPTSLIEAGNALQRQVSVSPSGISANEPQRLSDRRRPRGGIRGLPELAYLPHRIDGTTVAWDLHLDPVDDPIEIGRRLHGLGLVDPHILQADIERHHGAGTWAVVVDFDIEPPSWGLSVIDRRRLLVSIGNDRTAHHQEEEGHSHGNG